MFVVTYLGFMEYLSYDHENKLLGGNIDKGDTAVNFSCCYDHHGDGTDVNIYEGDAVEYASLDLAKLESLPDSSLNNNEYKYEQKWVPVSAKTEVGLRAIDLARQAVTSVDGRQQKKAEEIFSLLMSHEGSFYAYIYNDSDSIDFWVINPELAKFVSINYYN